MERVENEEVRRRASIERKSGVEGSDNIEMVWASGENG